MNVVKYGRTDKGGKHKSYKSRIPIGLKSMIQGANSSGVKISLTIEDYEQIKGCKCVFCGSGRNITVIVQDNTSILSIDNVAPCCCDCSKLIGQMNYNDFIILVNKIALHLSRSGAVSVGGGEYETNFAKYEQDKDNFEEA